MGGSSFALGDAMDMKRTTTVLWIIAAAIIIAVVAILINHFAGILADRTETNVDDKGVESSQVAPEGEAPAVEESGEVTEEAPQPSMEPAKRIVQVPDSMAEVVEEVVAFYQTEITGQNIAEVTLSTMGKSLEGNLLAAYRMRGLLEKCDTSNISPDELEAAIEQANRSAEYDANEGEPYPPEGKTHARYPGEKIYPTSELNRTYMTAWYEGCAKLRRMLSPDLRQELDDLAQGGDVMARYLYAIWVPFPDDSEQGFNFEVEWSRKAMEYSYLNFDAGEAAGFLALGQSYRDTLFTRESPYLAGVLLMVAIQCGVEDPVLIRSMILRPRGRNFETIEALDRQAERHFEVSQNMAMVCK